MTENRLKLWLDSLTVTQHREAVAAIIARFEFDRSTLYAWKREGKRFTTIEREELNKISQSISNTNIFEA